MAASILENITEMPTADAAFVSDVPTGSKDRIRAVACLSGKTSDGRVGNYGKVLTKLWDDGYRFIDVLVQYNAWDATVWCVTRDVELGRRDPERGAYMRRDDTVWELIIPQKPVYATCCGDQMGVKPILPGYPE